MSEDLLTKFLPDKKSPPNKFTIAMGELIRKAREDSGLSQTELAKLIYRRQASLSDIENGKMFVDALTLFLIAHSTNKPITYFFKPWLTEIPGDDLTPEEQELLLNARRLNEDDLRKIVAQIRALVEFQEQVMIERMSKEFRK